MVGVAETRSVDGAMAARYWMTFLVFSVFPAPDSPLDAARSARLLARSGDHNLRDQDTLTFSLFTHLHPSPFRRCKDMRRSFIPPFLTVCCHNLRSVQSQVLVWVDGDQEKSVERYASCQPLGAA